MRKFGVVSNDPDHYYSPASARDGDFYCQECGCDKPECSGAGGGSETEYDWELDEFIAATRPRTPAPFVAVVVSTDSDHISDRPEGDWAAFLGSTERDAVTRALQAAAKWGKFRKYTVKVGRLYGEAEVPTQYTIRAFGEAA